MTKLDSLQGLRGIAAGLVVAFHSVASLKMSGWAPEYTSGFAVWGMAGVDIFFVISGFVMVLTTANRPRGIESAQKFMLARLIRIAPMYWILTTFMVMLLLLAPSAFNKEKFSIARTITSYLFLPYEVRDAGHSYPVLYVGWTLAYEMFFYVVFAISLCFAERPMRYCVVAIFMTLGIGSLLIQPDAFYLRFITNPMMLEFVFGCMIGWIYTRGMKFPKLLSAALVAAGIFGLAMSPITAEMENRFILAGIPSASLVAGLVFWESANGWIPKFVLLSVGDASYSIYLTHTLTVPIFARGLGHFDKSRALQGDIACLLLVIASTLVGYVVYRAMERPLSKALRALVGRMAATRHDNGATALVER
ncbi:acyltransferase family protein (plasmid) [Caballeronia sp. NK8]|uniref:acyltransferase family protein n=1 Tax=Caballeronia sp. NK8 TaxID=140098 RepID=UPI001BB7EFDF|nr:acyltransferase [Caballeronia sp. NK8]BCQ29480.1 acyltransferase family protein [Caballeronia sp. NK8]